MKDVSIRPTRFEDAAAIQRCCEHPRLSTYMFKPYPFPVEGGMNFVRAAERGRRNAAWYSFTVLQNGNFAGLTLLDCVDWEQLTAELSFWIAVEAWGQGLASSAVRDTIRHAWDVLKLGVLIAYCHHDNLGSRAVLGKFGFEQTRQFIGQGVWGGKFEGATWLEFRAQNDTIRGRIED